MACKSARRPQSRPEHRNTGRSARKERLLPGFSLPFAAPAVMSKKGLFHADRILRPGLRRGAQPAARRSARGRFFAAARAARARSAADGAGYLELNTAVTHGGLRGCHPLQAGARGLLRALFPRIRAQRAHFTLQFRPPWGIIEADFQPPGGGHLPECAHPGTGARRENPASPPRTTGTTRAASARCAISACAAAIPMRSSGGRRTSPSPSGSASGIRTETTRASMNPTGRAPRSFVEPGH